MEIWHIFLIIFGIIIFTIIISSARRSKKRQPKRGIDIYLNHGDYISAGKFLIKQRREADAADLYFQTPPEKKPLYEEMILQQLNSQNAQFFWIKTGRRYERSSQEKAKIAYLLAGAYFDAVKMFIDVNDPINAIEIIRHIPINQQESTVRRLAQYSFNRGKYVISADLLRAIGLIDEADAIVAVAAYEFGVIERPEVAATLYDSVGRQDLVGESLENRGEQALKEGKIEAAKKAFERAIKTYDDTNQPKDALRVEERLKKFDLLDEFREYITKGDIESAEELIGQITDCFPAIAVSDLYAEIAAVLERSGRPSEAITYFDKAADTTNNPIKRQGYVNALRRIGSQIATQARSETIASKDFSAKCIVCRGKIRKGEEYVSCPNCKGVAHYSHLIEWVKVQGACPKCFIKLKVDDFMNT